MTEIYSAGPELLALAATMRPDWDESDLEGALASAAGNGWPFAKACLAAVRLLVKPDSEARDLLAEVANPLSRPELPAGDAAERGAAIARSALAGALIELDRQREEAEQAARAERIRQLAEASRALTGGDAA